MYKQLMVTICRKSDALHVHIARHLWSGETTPLRGVCTPMVKHYVGRCRRHILRVSRNESVVHKELNSVHTPNKAVFVKSCFWGPGNRPNTVIVFARCMPVGELKQERVLSFNLRRVNLGL